MIPSSNDSEHYLDLLSCCEAWCDYLEQELVARQPMHRAEEEGGQTEAVALGLVLQCQQRLPELLRALLVACQRPHRHLELADVRTVHVDEL